VTTASSRTRTRKSPTTTRAQRSKKTSTPKPAPKAGVPTVAAVAAGRSLWLAGLGLAAVAVESATGVFDALVAKGRVHQPAARAAAERAAVAVRRQAEALGELAADAARDGQRRLRGALDLLPLGADRSPRPKNLLHRLGDLADAML
jgi:hypothetical protein